MLGLSAASTREPEFARAPMAQPMKQRIREYCQLIVIGVNPPTGNETTEWLLYSLLGRFATLVFYTRLASDFGSRASRRPSPSRLKPSTANEMAIPGAIGNQG